MFQISSYNNQASMLDLCENVITHSIYSWICFIFCDNGNIPPPPPPPRRWWAICKSKSMEIIPFSEPPHYGKCNSDQDYTVRYHVGQHNSGWRSRSLKNCGDFRGSVILRWKVLLFWFKFQWNPFGSNWKYVIASGNDLSSVPGTNQLPE